MSARRKGPAFDPSRLDDIDDVFGPPVQAATSADVTEVPDLAGGANHSGTSRPSIPQPTPHHDAGPGTAIRLPQAPTRRRTEAAPPANSPAQRCASPRDRAGDQRFVGPPNAPCQSSRRAAPSRRGPHSATALQRCEQRPAVRTRATLPTDSWSSGPLRTTQARSPRQSWLTRAAAGGRVARADTGWRPRTCRLRCA